MPLIPTVLIVGFVFLCIGVALGVLGRRRRVNRHGLAAIASLDQLNTVFAGLERDLAHQRAETELVRTDRDFQKRRADEYFAKIDGCVVEATECRKLLVHTGASHGAAQAMMLHEIESLAAQYRWLAEQYRQDVGRGAPAPRLNLAIQEVAAEFREQYVTAHQNQPSPTPSP